MFKVMLQLLAVAFTISQAFEPARAEQVGMQGSPFNTAAAGVAMSEITVDVRGRVSAVRVLHQLAPFSSVLRNSVRGWTFEPAREGGDEVESQVLVAGLFRPAMLMFPAPDAVPSPEAETSEEIPLPTRFEVPPYPANAVGDAYVVTEVEIGDDGNVRSAEALTPSSGFDDAALSAARQWRFRPAHKAGSPVAVFAYLVFGFRQPQ